MIYNTLAIFSDAELVEVEFTLNQWTLMPQGTKNELTKALEDYKFLVSSLSYTTGLSEQVILFLLDKKSSTNEGIQEFLRKLELWVVILEDENEQRIYADIIRYWSVPYLDSDEILTLRSDLIDILVEIEETKRTLKKTKNSQDTLVKNKIPMQSDGQYDSYATWMMNYGEGYEDDNSAFNIVPNLKGKLDYLDYDSFAAYNQVFEVPTLQD